jgi:hypothetical protein
MKRLGKHTTLLILSFFALVFTQAQVSVRSNINVDNILIGEPVSLTVEAYVPLGANVTWFYADSIPHFDIMNKSAVDTSQGIDGKKLVQSFTITSFDSGQQYIPPFDIAVDGQHYLTDSVLITVSFAPFDPNADYRDIKEIIEVNNPAVKYIPWIIAAVAILSLAIAIFLAYRRKAKKMMVKSEPVSLLTPYEEAMKALAILALKNGNNGEVKNYYSDMNDILRKYVSRKFSVSTFQKTNEELILELNGFGIPGDAYKNLAQSLRMADSVKFAKYQPTSEDNRTNLNIVTNSIEILDKNTVSAV